MVSGLTPPDKTRDFKELAQRVDDLRDTVRVKSASTNVIDSTGFGIGGRSQEVGDIIGTFAFTPSTHFTGIQISWSGATGNITGGDTVDTDASAWKGVFRKRISGNDAGGTGFFEKVNATSFTNVNQTLNVSTTWTTAKYTLGSLINNAVLISSTSVLIDDVNGDPEVENFISTVLTDGQIILIKPVNGKNITLKVGGNIDIDSDISVGDSSFAFMQFHKNNINKDPLGTWSVVGAGGGGGSSGGGASTWKAPCRTATGTNYASLDPVADFIGGVTLVEGDRVLINTQDDKSENGIYVMGAITTGLGSLTRAQDFDSDAEVVSESFVAVEEGDDANTLWHLTTNNPITVDVTDQVWEEFGAVGSGSLPIGTENQHLEWDDTAGEWQARTNLEFGPTGPWAQTGFIRFQHDALISWRNFSDDGDTQLKLATSSNYIDWTRSLDGLNTFPLRWRLRAQGGQLFPDAIFYIEQNAPDTSETFQTEISFPKFLQFKRGGTDMLSFDQFNDIDHWNNGEYRLQFLRFYSFGSPIGSGDGSQISRFGGFDDPLPDPDGSVKGLHYDMEPEDGEHVFRVGNGDPNMFVNGFNPPITKWKITSDRNVTSQPIEFNYIWTDDPVEADSTGPVNEPRIFRGVEGMYFQAGIDGRTTGYGVMKFIDNTGLTSFVDQGRIAFDFDLQKTIFNQQSGGFKIRLNKDDNYDIQFHPPLGDIHSAFPMAEVNDAIMFVHDNSFPTGGLIFIGGFGGFNQMMRIQEDLVNIWEDVDFSKRAVLSLDPPIEGSNLMNTGDITPFDHNNWDIGTFDNRYEFGFFGAQVFTPKVGETGEHTNYNSFNITQNIVGFGSHTIRINSDDVMTINIADANFDTDVNLISNNNDSPQLKLWRIDESDYPIGDTNQIGKLFARRVVVNDNNDTEVHPFWIGHEMSEPVDLMNQQSSEGGGIVGSGVFRCKSFNTDRGSTPASGWFNNSDGVFHLVGDIIFFLHANDPMDNGPWEVTGFTFGITLVTLKRPDGWTAGTDVEPKIQIIVDQGEMGTSARFELENNFGETQVDTYDLWFRTIYRKTHLVLNGNVTTYTGDSAWNYPLLSTITHPDSESFGTITGLTANDNGGFMKLVDSDVDRNDPITATSIDAIPDYQHVFSQADIDSMRKNMPEGVRTYGTVKLFRDEDQIANHHPENIGYTFFLMLGGGSSGSGSKTTHIYVTINDLPLYGMIYPTDTGVSVNDSNPNIEAVYEGVNAFQASYGHNLPNFIPPLRDGDVLKVYWWKIGTTGRVPRIDDIALWMIPQKIQFEGAITGGTHLDELAPDVSALSGVASDPTYVMKTTFTKYELVYPESGAQWGFFDNVQQAHTVSWWPLDFGGNGVSPDPSDFWSPSVFESAGMYHVGY